MADSPSASFGSSFFGYSKAEVDSAISKLKIQIESLEDSTAQMKALVAASEGQPPAYDEVGKDISKLLADADAAAKSMRDRAFSEAAALTRATAAETSQLASEASAAADQLRGDAWAESQKMVEEAQEAARQLVGVAEEDSRRRKAESEREAHRVVMSGRREAEEVIATANHDSDQTLQASAKRRDEMLDQAKAAEAASQNRARALEVRKEELLAELESVRETVGRLETAIEEKQTTLRKIDDPAPVAESEPAPEWAAGIRIIPQSEFVGEPQGDLVAAEEIVDDVLALQTEVALEAKAAEAQSDEPPALIPDIVSAEAVPPAEDPQEEPTVEKLGTSSQEVEPEEVPEASPDNKLDALFASLRDTGGVEEPTQESVTQVEAAEDQGLAPVIELAKKKPPVDVVQKATPVDASKLVEIRDRSVVGVVNVSLRTLKRELAAIQNRALEAIRLDATWRADIEELSGDLAPHLEAAAGEAFDAGVRGFNAEYDAHVSVPTPPEFEVALVARDLEASISRALRKGSDDRAKASEVSRVFRSWRSEAAERHLVQITTRAYNQGVAGAIGKSGGFAVVALSGRGCSTCKAADGNSAATVPPLHDGCGCAVTRSG